MLVISAGRVIDPASGLDAEVNVFVRDGVVAEVSRRAPEAGWSVVDAKGLCVTPGFIDLHTHLREPGFEYKEDIASGSSAAAAGGFTTILSMPNTKPVCDNAEVVRQIIDRAKSVGLVNVLPVGAMSVGLLGDSLADIDGMVRAGAVAISDDGGCIQDAALMRRALQEAKRIGIVAISHPEDLSMSRGGVMNDGPVAGRLGVKGIPTGAENGMIRRDIDLCRETKARLHLAHVSTAKGIAMVREAKREGWPVTCEVAPHHLLLIDEAVVGLGANGKMNPPLRTEEDRQSLIEALGDGTVDAIATDHAPHAPAEKEDLTAAPFGVIGMEAAFPACMRLVEEGRISLSRLVWLLTAGPARVMNLKAGRLAPGAPADVTIFDPDARYVFDAGHLRSKSKNCPFIGWKVQGRVVKTFKAAAG